MIDSLLSQFQLGSRVLVRRALSFKCNKTTTRDPALTATDKVQFVVLRRRERRKNGCDGATLTCDGRPQIITRASKNKQGLMGYECYIYM